MTSSEDAEWEAPNVVVSEKAAAAKSAAEAQKRRMAAGFGSRATSSSGPLSRYLTKNDYDLNWLSVFHDPDWKVVHEFRLTDSMTCISFLIGGVPPAEGLAMSIQPTTDLVDSDVTHLVGFQASFIEMYKRWSFDAFYAAQMSKEVKELQEKLATVTAAHDIGKRPFSQISVPYQYRTDRL
jgi:hypothetical protein